MLHDTRDSEKSLCLPCTSDDVDRILAAQDLGCLIIKAEHIRNRVYLWDVHADVIDTVLTVASWQVCKLDLDLANPVVVASENLLNPIHTIPQIWERVNRATYGSRFAQAAPITAEPFLMNTERLEVTTGIHPCAGSGIACLSGAPNCTDCERFVRTAAKLIKRRHYQKSWQSSRDFWQGLEVNQAFVRNQEEPERVQCGVLCRCNCAKVRV